MKNWKKLICLLCIALMITMCFAATVTVSAAETVFLQMSSEWPPQESNFTANVGWDYNQDLVGAGLMEVTFSTEFFEYSHADNKAASTTIDTATSGVVKIFIDANDVGGIHSFRQKLVFKVKATAKVGDKGTISVKVFDLSNIDGDDLGASQAPVSKKITVVGKPTPTPTPTPTKTPAWTPSATTPGVTQTPIGTNELDPSGTPGAAEGTFEEEILPPSETPELTVTPESTPKPTTAPTKTPDNQALLIKSGALGFWMMVVLIVGIWIGIAIGYFIWGRKKGRSVRRSKVIGNDEF
ncbi:MAG: hypothetical protein IKV74_02440 [Clostridia bacterium]|nr:hypothetical protein [Clostridia bacterium]